MEVKQRSYLAHACHEWYCQTRGFQFRYASSMSSSMLLLSSYHLFLCFDILFYPFLASNLLSIQLILIWILQLALDCTTIYPFRPSVYFSVRVTTRKRDNCQHCSLFVNQLSCKETYHPSHFIIEILPPPPSWIPSDFVICTRLSIWISVVCGSGLEPYYDVVRPKEWQSNQGYHCVCKRKSTPLSRWNQFPASC